jgi:hypothetical protein
MFLTRRPSRHAIERFLGKSQELPLSYSPIGLIRKETSNHGIDEAVVTRGAHFGFAYGSLTNHAEAGEELFEVFLNPKSDEVTYRIRAVSWPRMILTRIGYPIARLLQARFRQDSAEAMRRATSGRGL